MKRIPIVLFSLLALLASPAALHAQSVPAATAHHISLTAGVLGTAVQPDFDGQWTASAPYYPVAHASTYPLIGAGAFVDLKFGRWVQFEAEGHWLRFNQYSGISQDNYLAGPRVPVLHYRKATVYAKALIGFSMMTFDDLGDHGHFTTTAFGGGVDYRLTKRLSFRAIDAEYQYWPKWGNATLSPYGVSTGLSYRIF